MNQPQQNTLVMTHSGVRLRQPLSQEPGERLVCGFGFPMQVSPTEVGMLVNIRNGGVSVIDYENGWDFIIFGSLGEVRSERATKGLRQHREMHPRSGCDLTMVQHLPHGGFVPLGAKLHDGRPHPYAGTGFGISVVHGYPADNSERNAHVLPDIHTYWRLVQFSYDGEKFEWTRIDDLGNNDFLPGWSFTNRGLSCAIRDGEDLLFAMAGGPANGEAVETSDTVMQNGHGHGCGVGRWRFGENGWQLVDFVPVGDADNSYEPTLLRDNDNSLLMCVRGVRKTVDMLLHFRVYRSHDNGVTWDTTIDLPNQRAASPVTLLQTNQGRPFIAANPWLGREFGSKGQPFSAYATRHRLWFWLLSEDRRSIGEPHCAFNADEVLGRPRECDALANDNLWYVDHPIGGLFRLADKQWHSLVSFRVSDIAFNVGGAQPVPPLGTWIEEVFDSALDERKTLPWQF